MTFNELMQKYVDSSYEELVAHATEQLNKAFPVLTKCLNGSKEDAIKFFLIVVGACVAVDGKLTALEAKFARDVFGDSLTDDSIMNLANSYSSAESRQALDELVDALDSDTKVAICCFCSAFFAVDETITRDESAFIAKLLQN